jgi:hypothetical protein
MMHIMTKLLDQAIAQLRELPDEAQDDAADALFAHIAGKGPRHRLTAEQVEDVKRIQRDLRSGATRIASEAEIAALWKKCGL